MPSHSFFFFFLMLSLLRLSDFSLMSPNDLIQRQLWRASARPSDVSHCILSESTIWTHRCTPWLIIQFGSRMVHLFCPLCRQMISYICAHANFRLRTCYSKWTASPFFRSTLMEPPAREVEAEIWGRTVPMSKIGMCLCVYTWKPLTNYSWLMVGEPTNIGSWWNPKPDLMKLFLSLEPVWSPVT